MSEQLSSEQLSLGFGVTKNADSWFETGGKDARGGNRAAKFPWASEHIEQLRGLAASGLAASKIADEMGGGLSRSAVLGKLFRLGIHTKNPPKRAIGRAKPRKQAKPRVQLYPERQRKKYQRKPPMIFDNHQPQTADVVPLNLTIFELTATTCRWPYGDVPNMKFCGHPVDGERPYCVGHCRIAYRPERMREAA